MLKCQNQLKNQTTSDVKTQNLEDIEFDEYKLRKLSDYYDYYSNDNESADDEYEDTGIEEGDEDEEIIVKTKKILKRKT